MRHTEYSDNIMLCFVHGFERSPTHENLETFNLESSRSKLSRTPSLSRRKPASLKKLLVNLPNADGTRDIKEPSTRRQVVVEERRVLVKPRGTSPGDRILRVFPDVKRSFSERFSVLNDVGARTTSRGPNSIRKCQSSSNFSGAGGFPGPVARSAPATPLQAEATPPPPPRTPVHSFAKCDKGAVKQLSSSAPSVSADVAGVGAGGVGAGTAPVGAGSDAGSGDKSPRAPGKARQKKFLRHFPQVGPDERVLNYYSCALVGDILLQGHLYITKNYFAFYSNVFGYVTKLLIPIASVLRVSKEKLARIIPNAVGVATADERHVFGSLLSRDTTYKYMLKVWKEATAAPLLRDTRVQPAKELRVSEAELEASEYSQDDDSSCSGSGGDGLGRGARVMAGGVVGAANLRHRAAATPARGLGDDTGVLKQPPVIQPALLLKSPTPNGRGAWGARAARTTGRTRACVATLAAVALLLTMSAALLLYRIHQHHIQHNFNGLGAGVSGNAVYGELLRWQGELRTHSATQVHRFLAHNLQQLTKVRQSLEALSSMMITDSGGNRQSFTSGNSESTEVLTGS